MDEQSTQQEAPPRVLNPLWIISLFLGLAELTVGIATTQATGWIQGLLAIFSVGFPCAVAAAFFLILWKRPFVLYAPRDYPDKPGIQDYASAVSSAADRSLKNVEEAIRAAFEQVITPQLTMLGDENRSRSVVDRAVETARRNFRQRVVEVELTNIHPSLAPLEFPVTESTTVSDLLDGVYFAIADFVDSFMYNHRWTLEDAETGHQYREIGTRWARSALGGGRDHRPLKEVGIQPGDRLVARWLRTSGQ
jgi:hypothetical protein